MLVTQQKFGEVLELIKKASSISLDTETTGLRLHQKDRLFSVVIGTQSETFYFNCKMYSETTDNEVIPFEWLRDLNDLTPRIIAMANAKFDLHAMAKEGVDLTKHQIWDVLTIAKCLENKHLSYSLDNVAKRMGYEKLNTVEEYIAKHKLFTIEQSPGKKTKSKNPHYDMVPLPLIQEYAERDARITYDIFEKQMIAVQVEHERSIRGGYPSFWDVIFNEMKTTEVCFHMEQRGMEIDHEHIERCLHSKHDRALSAKARFLAISGKELVDSNKALSEAFAGIGVTGGRTKKGNPSFTDDVLSVLHSPIAEAVRDYRDATKRANTYYKSFLSFADSNGVVHPNIRQAGADTFRFSITDPALQTLNSEETGEYRVRDAFRARDGFYLVSIDYAQQEYRLAADYAGESALIREILAGVDVHEATARLMGLPLDDANFKTSRGIAKTINFMLLYGGGVPKLCTSLFKPKLPLEVLQQVIRKYVWKSHVKRPWLLEHVSASDLAHDIPLLEQAQKLQDTYFSALPKIKKLIEHASFTARTNKRIYNWAGRKLDFKNFRMPDPDYEDAERAPWIVTDESHKATNYLIQSSGAEIMRRAMIALHEFLKPYKTKMLLSIHDELLFEMPDDHSEIHLIPEMRALMASVYKPHNGLMMDTSVAWGKSWGSLMEGMPNVEETRDAVS